MIAVGPKPWTIHVWVDHSYECTSWYWTATNGDRKAKGSTSTRWGAKREAKRFCDNPNPKPKRNKYDFTFDYYP
jgi:hypothetical protein